MGNIILLKDYLKIYNGEILRFALLSTHYRSPLLWTESLIVQSKNILDKFYEVLIKLESIEIDNDDLMLPSEIRKMFF